MRRSFSLRTLMAGVLLASVGFAALHSASVVSYRVAYTLTTLMLLIAIVAARYGRPSSRPFWFGFAVFGWGYYLLSFGAWVPDSRSSGVPWLRSVPSGLNPSLITTAWVGALAVRIAPFPVPAPLLPKTPGYRGGIIRLADGGYAVEKTHCAMLHLHLILCLAIATTGGVLARVLAANSCAARGQTAA